MSQNPHRAHEAIPRRKRAPRLDRSVYAIPGMPFHLTICARPGISLTSPRLGAAIVQALRKKAQDEGFRLFAYCIMPDHVHFVIAKKERRGGPPCPPEEVEANDSYGVIQFVQEFKSLTTSVAWKLGLKRKVWQRSFYDHALRKEEDLAQVCEYVLANPVRRGICEEREDWPWSWWNEEGWTED